MRFRGGMVKTSALYMSAVWAPLQEIFHSNSGIAVLQKAWNSALDYSKNFIIIIILRSNILDNDFYLPKVMIQVQTSLAYSSG